MSSLLTRKAFKGWLEAQEPTQAMAGFLCDCPIARFLQEATKASNVHVGVIAYLIGDRLYNHPKWAHDFVCAFDDMVMDNTSLNKATTVSDALRLL